MGEGKSVLFEGIIPGRSNTLQRIALEPECVGSTNWTQLDIQRQKVYRKLGWVGSLRVDWKKSRRNVGVSMLQQTKCIVSVYEIFIELIKVL